MVSRECRRILIPWLGITNSTTRTASAYIAVSTTQERWNLHALYLLLLIQRPTLSTGARDASRNNVYCTKQNTQHTCIIEPPISQKEKTPIFQSLLAFCDLISFDHHAVSLSLSLSLPMFPLP